MFERILRAIRWHRPPDDDVHMDQKGRLFSGPRALYDMRTADYPLDAPFGVESADWLAAVLSKFQAERLQEAPFLARNKTSEDRQDPIALRNWLGSIWDAVSRELDCTDLPEEQQEK